MWFEQKHNENNMKRISVAYHKAVKRVAGKRPWDSNHDACNLVRVNIFKHLLSKRLLSQFFNITNSCNGLMRSLKYYFMFTSNFNSFLDERFFTFYEIVNFKSNDKMALISRINFVENHEERSHYTAST